MPADPICPGDAKVEISEDGTVWVDITDWTRRIDPGERTRTLLVYQTFTGPKSCIGPAEPVEIELEFLYTEADTGEPYAIIRNAHYEGTTLGIRWQAHQGAGAKAWTAATANVPTFDEPEISADSDEPIGVLATLSADVIDWAVAA
jgi:hypothetical protein